MTRIKSGDSDIGSWETASLTESCAAFRKSGPAITPAIALSSVTPTRSDVNNAKNHGASQTGRKCMFFVPSIENLVNTASSKLHHIRSKYSSSHKINMRLDRARTAGNPEIALAFIASSVCSTHSLSSQKDGAQHPQVSVCPKKKKMKNNDMGNQSTKGNTRFEPPRPVTVSAVSSKTVIAVEAEQTVTFMARPKFRWKHIARNFSHRLAPQLWLMKTSTLSTSLHAS
mmetsp:Transcript_8973/g.21269  ORF Transcript_8973/g.21269 Transcript_8973/m.21269 type:complete len:228 (-) Transcript_8973:85-768(-)